MPAAGIGFSALALGEPIIPDLLARLALIAAGLALLTLTGRRADPAG